MVLGERGRQVFTTLTRLGQVGSRRQTVTWQLFRALEGRELHGLPLGGWGALEPEGVPGV